MQLKDPGSHDVILVGPVCKTALNASVLAGLKLSQSPQLAVDGGIHFTPKPYAWFGDGDSSAPPKAPVPALWKENQNLSDLQFCLSTIRTWEWDTMHAFGFLGDRHDHELSNLGTFFGNFKDRPGTLQISLYDNSHRLAAFILPAGTHEINLQGFFSVLSLYPNVFSISGQCRYPAHEIQLEPLSSQGISNEGTGFVVVQNSAPILIFVNL